MLKDVNIRRLKSEAERRMSIAKIAYLSTPDRAASS